MDFRQLEVFVSICRTGNFSKAAQELFLTQPTVSSHIFQLEKDLGLSLFERRGRKVVLTPAGENFYPYALDVLDLMKRARESFQEYKDQIKGTVKIIASQTPGNYLLPSLLKKFNVRYPEVKFEISISNSDDVYDKILNYEADLGFVGKKYTSDKIENIYFQDDELILISPNNSKLKNIADNNSEIQLEKIVDMPFIIRRGGSATLKTFEDYLQKEFKKDINSLNIILEVDSIESVKSFVKEGFGVSILSRHCLSEEDSLLKYKIKGIDFKREFYSIYHKGRVLSPTCEKLLDYIENEDKLEGYR
ncbi:selenium metabolism-associated LysR family transcriptional regulator [Natranaerofaba carboxydovora]|uniref:selenium metabolism-associated LysR family transcriptional regulator n=1 Tax=Natranaerofaba carboxydovora TaxID=2742683 RepID=UPI001F139EC8|nr:selenium metabolism-associated LysR family transcriptional regulator [Natranaerofaba carboxydovora]UMZ75082.1 HTH-type transcriptional activator CmpR [Natranaerofaba carboxydovora]